MRYLTLLLTFLLMPAADAGVAFMYHRVGDDRFPSTNVTVAQFEQHLDYLAERKIPVWPLARLLQAMSDSTEIPDEVVAITVDDAYLSFYENGAPLLEEYGFPYTVFVSTDAVDQGLADYMSWEQLRDLMKRGGAIANHTASHAYLLEREAGETDKAWLQRVQQDIGKAQQRLQAELGDETNESPRLFAFPYGEYDRALADRVSEMGYIAFGQHSGAFDAATDRRALPRFPINEHYATLSDFGLKAHTLAMPVLEVSPWNPVIEDGKPPLMTVRLGESRLRPESLSCYFESEQLVPEWTEKGKVFEVQGSGELPASRSRYNCTARHRDNGRYFWFSHPWIN